MYLQQLPVEDTNNSRTVQAVGCSAALAQLESIWQFLDFIPFTKILQRKHREHKCCKSSLKSSEVKNQWRIDKCVLVPN